MAVSLVAGLPLACDLPRDPEGTFDRARDAVVRAGFTASPPWVTLTEHGDEDDEPAGIEPLLVAEFARRIGSHVEWRHGSETQLVEWLERGELDVAIGGFKDSTPWSKRTGMTRPFVRMNGDRHVMLVRLGENRWLLELDRFLQSRESDVERRIRNSVGDERP